MNKDLKDFEYLWAEESFYYAERCGRYNYVIIEIPHGKQTEKMALLIEAEEPIYDAIVQKMLKMGRGIDDWSWKEDECLDCCLKGENQEEILVCPMCNQKSYRYKASIGEILYQCDLCGAGVITTYFPPCMCDHEIYELVISEPSSLTRKEIAKIGSIFHYRYNQILINIRAGVKVSFTGGFKDVIAKERELKTEKVASIIFPQPPYSMYHDCVEKDFIR